MRQASDPWSSPNVVELWKLAEEDGSLALKSFRSSFDEEQLRDIIFDWMTKNLAKVVAAAEARPFFWSSVRRAAISWKRRQLSKVAEAKDDGSSPARDASSSEEDAHVAALDARASWQTIGERDRQIYSAVLAGEDRDRVAEHWNVKRNSVDQVISRVRKRLGGGDT